MKSNTEKLTLDERIDRIKAVRIAAKWFGFILAILSLIMVIMKVPLSQDITDYSKVTFYLVLGSLGIYLGYVFVKYGQAKK